MADRARDAAGARPIDVVDRPDDRRRHPRLRGRPPAGRARHLRGAGDRRRRHASRELRRGFRIEPGERVLLVDDVVTTGGSLLEMLPADRGGRRRAGAGGGHRRSVGRADRGRLARYRPDLPRRGALVAEAADMRARPGQRVPAARPACRSKRPARAAPRPAALSARAAGRSPTSGPAPARRPPRCPRTWPRPCPRRRQRRCTARSAGPIR